MEMRICKKCNIEKKLNKENFYWRNDNKKFRKECIQCLQDADHERVLNGNRKKYYDKNKDKINKNKRNNRKMPQNRKKTNEKQKEKLKTDITFRIKSSISSLIRSALIYRGGSKSRKPIKDILPYTPNELRLHLELQFEPWMTWNNRAHYNPKTWDNNDSSTWTWELDHIKPHSDFKYTSVDDEDFQECWALSNLRPYNAKQNLFDGLTRVRHAKKAA